MMKKTVVIECRCGGPSVTVQSRSLRPRITHLAKVDGRTVLRGSREQAVAMFGEDLVVDVYPT
jgi:hypothetical protein